MLEFVWILTIYLSKDDSLITKYEKEYLSWEECQQDKVDIIKPKQTYGNCLPKFKETQRETIENDKG